MTTDDNLEPADGITRDITDGLLVDALLTGATYGQAAEQANLSPSTVSRRMKDAAFVARLTAAAADRDQATNVRLVDAISETVTYLSTVVKDTERTDNIRLAAAKILLEAQRTRRVERTPTPDALADPIELEAAVIAEIREVAESLG